MIAFAQFAGLQVSTLRSNVRRFPIPSLIVLLLVVLSAHSLEVKLSTGLLFDEYNYMEMARELAGGEKLFTSYIDHIPPGVAIIDTPFIWVFGNTNLAIKAAVIFYCVLFGLAVGYIAYSFTKSHRSAVLAWSLATLFAGLYSQKSGMHVALFCSIALTLGIACALRSGQNRWGMIWSTIGGLLLGLSFWTQPTILLEIPIVIALVYIFHRRWLSTSIFVGGIVAGISTIVLFFAATGTLNEMLYVTFTQNSGYVAGDNSGGILAAIRNHLDYLNYLFERTVPFYSFLLALAPFMWLRSLSQRSAFVLVVSLWAVLSFADSFIAISMDTRYFFHIVAPLILLIVLPLERMLQDRSLQVAMVFTAPLLVLAYLQPTLPKYSRSDFATSLNFLQTNLDKQECFLAWGSTSLGSLRYLSGHKSCGRIALEGTMMLTSTYDVRQLRAWYLQDILTNRPKLLAKDEVWSFFPQLARFADHHVGAQLFKDEDMDITYYTMDWSSYYESDGNIDGKIDLRGYDLVPSRVVPAGSDIEVTLYWDVLDKPTSEYQGFVHLTTLDYETNIAGEDNQPTEPYLSTLLWTYKHELIIGRPYKVAIPKNLPPGEYALIAGFYRFGADGKVETVDHFNRKTNQPIPFLSLGSVTVK